MAIKLTKNELKKQKDNLKQFQRYLPTLQLKKQQLQSVIMKIRQELEQKEAERIQMIGDLDDWVAVFAENEIFDEDKKLDNLVQPDKVIVKNENIAEEMADVRGAVTSGYQDVLEQRWKQELAKKYPAKINKKVLKKVK